jgi:hypothetical protein
MLYLRYSDDILTLSIIIVSIHKGSYQGNACQILLHTNLYKALFVFM